MIYQQEEMQMCQNCHKQIFPDQLLKNSSQCLLVSTPRSKRKIKIISQQKHDIKQSKSITKVKCAHCNTQWADHIFSIHQQNCIQYNKHIKQLQQKKKKQAHQLEIRQSNDLYWASFTAEDIILEEDYICQKCGQQYQASKYQIHNMKCRSLFKKCEYCSDQFPAIVIKQHINVCQVKKKQEESKWRIKMQKMKKQIDKIAQKQKAQSIRSTRTSSRISAPPIRYSNTYSNYYNQPQRSAYNRYQPTRYTSSYMYEKPKVDKGLTLKQFLRLDRINYQVEKGQDVDQCSICLKQYQFDERLIKFDCKHLFHQKCVQKWLQQKSVCPTCKCKIKVCHFD